jgi:hypothetical protein
MGAIERAKMDLERDDFGAARRRLASCLHTRGYDTPLLEELGRISHNMRDPYQAGRYWLASSAVGEEVERAIRAFAQHLGRDPQHMFSQLPPAVRLTPFEKLHPAAQERLRGLGLEPVFGARSPARPPVKEPGRLIHAVLFAGLIFLLIALIVGLITIGVGLTAVVRSLF